MTHPLALARQYAEQEADTSTCRQLLRAALDEVDRLTRRLRRLRRLPVVPTCGRCGFVGSVHSPGFVEDTVCSHPERRNQYPRLHVKWDAEPPSDCPLRGKP